MYRKEVNEQSPLRILEASIHGGLGRGNLGVVMSRAGVGKTACLVQIALDDLMRGRKVLHIALGGTTVDHVRAWYDALFHDLARLTQLEDRHTVAAQVAAGRIIQALPEPVLSPSGLERSAELFVEHLEFHPDAIIIDGFDWAGPGLERSAWLTAMKAVAAKMNAELWMSARCHREDFELHPSEVPPPCAKHREAIDVVLLLEPESDHVTLRLLKDHEHPDPPHDTRLQLQCDTLRIAVAGDDSSTIGRLPPEGCTLLSGGAIGAEASFGENAERWGLSETHYTFAGRTPARHARGLVVLDDEQLQEGAVSIRYIERHMHRTYPNTDRFKKILHSIWHQVNTSSAVFVVGELREDGTVKGGTGWQAELARHQHKTLYVFDQGKEAWFTWNGAEWVGCADPVVRTVRFTGSGTRFLNDAGRAAIEALFARSFGPAPDQL